MNISDLTENRNAWVGSYCVLTVSMGETHGEFSSTSYLPEVMDSFRAVRVAVTVGTHE
jgi:hypothetical protein